MSSLIGAFNLGVGGLFANSSAFSAISQNISNARTPGYRALDTEFATLLGGIDARGSQPGGVRSFTRTNMDLQGSLETTNRQFDLAISGPGLFVLGNFEGGSTADDFRYSRNGSMISIRGLPGDPVGYLGNETGLYLLGWPLQDGEPIGTNLSDLRPIPATTDDALEGEATTNAALVATIPPTEASASTQIFYFDASGTKQSAVLNWTKTAPNNWTLQPTDLGGVPLGGPIPMTFDGNGNITSATTVSIGGLFDLDVSRVNQVGTLFSLGQYTQNGISRGEFVSYSITNDGVVHESFTNGVTRPAFKIPIATFINPSALDEQSGSLYRVTDKSGQPTLNEVGDQNIQVTSGALELANFDLSDGFAKMIITQRAYQSSAQVVQTVDEMNQVVRDMKR